jgi:hypothetical protein
LPTGCGQCGAPVRGAGAHYQDGSTSRAESERRQPGQQQSQGTNFTGVNQTGANFSTSNLTGATGLKTTTLTNVTRSKTACPDGTTSNDDGGTCVGHL